MAQVLTFGELLLRLTPPNKQRINQANAYHSFFGGAEANVAINLSRYGHDTSLLTALPPNDVGRAAISTLQGAGVDTSFIARLGDRLGIYFYEEGFSVKQPQVVYDRKNSSFLQLTETSIDWDAVFAGKDVFHLTGITPALSEAMRDFTFDIVKAAKQRNVTISFDFNYRSKLWSIEEAKKVYVDLLPYVDICFMGFKDLVAFLEVESTVGFDEALLEKHYRDIAKRYDIAYLACTNRTIVSQSKNTLTGYMYHDGHFVASDCQSFDVLERIGGGDAFASGMLHGILSDMTLADTVEFGIASGVLKHTVYGDYTQFSNDDVHAFIQSNGGDVKR